MALDVANALKIAWLRAKDLGAGGSNIASWIDQATGTAQPSSGTAPTVAAASTPGGGKSARFTAGRIDLGLRGVRWTASTYQTDFEPFRAEGNDATTAWAATGAVGWLAFQLDSAVVATSYVLQGRAGASSQWPRNWTFEGSNDGISWTVLDTRTGADSGLGSLQTFTFSNSTAYSRYRLNVTTTAGGVATAGTLAVGGTAPALARELWMVLKSDAVTPNGSFGSFGAATADYYTYSDGLIYTGAFSSGRWQFTPTLAVTGWRLLRITHDGTSARAYLDNALQSTTTVGTQFNATGTLSTIGFVGNIAEAMFFDRALTASEAADLITYFNTEHGLTVPGGTTTSAQVESVYAETLASGSPAAQVEAVYAETLASGSPAVQVEVVYAEVLQLTAPLVDAQVEAVFAEALTSSASLAQVEGVFAEALTGANPTALVEGAWAEVLAPTVQIAPYSWYGPAPYVDNTGDADTSGGQLGPGVVGAVGAVLHCALPNISGVYLTKVRVRSQIRPSSPGNSTGRSWQITNAPGNPTTLNVSGTNDGSLYYYDPNWYWWNGPDITDRTTLDQIGAAMLTGDLVLTVDPGGTASDTAVRRVSSVTLYYNFERTLP